MPCFIFLGFLFGILGLLEYWPLTIFYFLFIRLFKFRFYFLGDCLKFTFYFFQMEFLFLPWYFTLSIALLKFYFLGTSLVLQWLRIRLPMQGTWVRALVWEDPTCSGATKLLHHNYWACTLEPVHHNYWACALEPVRHNYWAHVPQLLKPVRLDPVLHNKEKQRQWEACAPSPCWRK